MKEMDGSLIADDIGLVSPAQRLRVRHATETIRSGGVMPQPIVYVAVIRPCDWKLSMGLPESNTRAWPEEAKPSGS